MKNQTIASPQPMYLTPAQVELISMFDHNEVQDRIYDINSAFEWSFSIDYDLDQAEKNAQATLWQLVKLLVKINQEQPIRKLSFN